MKPLLSHSDDYRERLIFILNILKMYKEEPECRTHIRENIEKIPNEEILKCLKDCEKIIKEMDINISKSGVICFSKKCDDILLWSHYADKQHGVCLKFDTKILGMNFYEIDYRSKQYDMDELNGRTLVDYTEMVIIRKAEEWLYEGEWRAFGNIPLDPQNDEDRKRKFDKKALTGIFFGCMIKDDEKCKVLSWLKDWKKKPKLYLANKDQYKYKLNFIEKPYEKLKAELCPR